MLAIPPAGFAALTVWQVWMGHPWGRHPMSNGSVIFWTIFLFLLYARLATIRLVTDVFPDSVRVAMKGFWRSRRVFPEEIRTVKTTVFDPVRDYGGYGVRSADDEKAWIASGNQGVRLELTNGARLLIGSRQPKDLETAIRRLSAPTQRTLRR